MTVQERNQQIETRFRTVREHLTRANPNDFDRQIPPNFVSCDWEHQTITYAFDMEPRFGNPHGMGHGGIVAAAGLLCSGSMAAVRSAVRDHGRGVSSVAKTTKAAEKLTRVKPRRAI